MAKSVNRDINNRVKAICDKVFNGNLTQMAKTSYISRTTLISIIGEQQSAPGYDVLRKIVEIPIVDISEKWLLTGEGEMMTSSAASPNAKMLGAVYSVGSKDDGVIMVDYVPVSATASFIDNLTSTEKASFEKHPIVPFGNEVSDSDKLCIFEVDGDSMYPTIPSGAMILAKEIPEKSWHYAEGVVVAIYDTFVVVKRISKNNLLIDNTLVLASDNKSYGEMIVQLSDIRALYKAKRIISSPIN